MNSTVGLFFVFVLISIALLLTKDPIPSIIFLWFFYAFIQFLYVFITINKTHKIKEWYQTGEKYVDDGTLLRVLGPEEAQPLIKKRHYDHNRDIMPQRCEIIQKGFEGYDYPDTDPQKLIDNDKYWKQIEEQDVYGNIYYRQLPNLTIIWDEYPEFKELCIYHPYIKGKVYHYKPPK